MNEFNETGINAHFDNRPIERNLTNWRKEIITDILLRGLKSSQTLEKENQRHLKSVESALGDVYGRNFLPRGSFRDTRSFERFVGHALYNTDNSILTVVAERHGEGLRDKDLFGAPKGRRSDIEDKIESSLLVVYKGSDEGDLLTRNESDLDASEIVCVLIPREIYRSLIKTGVFENVEFDIRVINKTIKRRPFLGDKIRIPDYEGEIKKLLKEKKYAFVDTRCQITNS